MTPTTLPNQPLLAGDYDIGAGRHCRVLLKKTGSQNGHVTFEAQAYQVDAEGRLALDAAGWPVRTPGSPHSINLSGLAARNCSRDAGWIKTTPAAGAALDPQTPPEGWATGEGMPAAPGNEGDRYIDLLGGQGWEWSCGELERIRRGKVDELQQILVEHDLDAQAAAV